MVDFRKLMTPEKLEKWDNDRAYLAKERANIAILSDYDFLVRTLHTMHNTSRDINGYNKYDCVYDAALVFRILPELVERFALELVNGDVLREDGGLLRGPEEDKMHAFAKEIVVARKSGQPMKCPCKGCTGYVELS